MQTALPSSWNTIPCLAIDGKIVFYKTFPGCHKGRDGYALVLNFGWQSELTVLLLKHSFSLSLARTACSLAYTCNSIQLLEVSLSLNAKKDGALLNLRSITSRLTQALVLTLETGLSSPYMPDSAVWKYRDFSHCRSCFSVRYSQPKSPWKMQIAKFASQLNENFWEWYPTLLKVSGWLNLCLGESPGVFNLKTSAGFLYHPDFGGKYRQHDICAFSVQQRYQ